MEVHQQYCCNEVIDMHEPRPDIDGVETRRYWECGPMLLDTDKSLAMMDDEDLCLNEDEFNALYLLVKCEGSPMTQERLYKAVWEPPDGSDCREAARAALCGLVEKVNTAGKGVVWIDPSKKGSFVLWRHYCYPLEKDTGEGDF